MKTKEQLEQQIKELNELVSQAVVTKDNIDSQLSAAQQELNEVNMPTMTKSMRNTIRDAVEQAIASFDFDDSRSYEYDFEIGYDNQLSLSDINFENKSDLEEEICSYIEENFKIIEDAE